MNRRLWPDTARRLALAALASASMLAVAQTEKNGATEHVPAFPAFTEWVSTFVAAPQESPVRDVKDVSLLLLTTSTEDTYQPLPVVLGLPELPLVGIGAARAGKGWGPTFNYQGVYLRQVVLDARGTRRELRSMASPLRTGERFKIRVTATFDAVADVDQVLGDAWYGKRTGQVYPQRGLSVQLKAGESVDLPTGAHEYFVMNRPANERLVVSVRHPKALGGARSGQPAYRQDGVGGSSYLQLVPRGTFPAIEQLVSQAR